MQIVTEICCYGFFSDETEKKFSAIGYPIEGNYYEYY